MKNESRKTGLSKLSDQSLMETYAQAKELQLDQAFIEIIEIEMASRGLSKKGHKKRLPDD